MVTFSGFMALFKLSKRAVSTKIFAVMHNLNDVKSLCQTGQLRIKLDDMVLFCRNGDGFIIVLKGSIEIIF